MKFSRHLLVYSIVINWVTALVVIDSTLASSCIYYMNSFDWGCKSHGTGMALYKCHCSDLNWLGSVSNCITETSNSTRLKDHAMRHVAGRCKLKAGFDFSVDLLYTWGRNSTPYLQDPEYDVLLTHPVRTNTTEWEYYHQSFKDYAFEVEKSQWFGWGLIFFWSTIMFCATLLNINSHFVGLRIETSWFKRYISLPSTFNSVKNNEQVFYLWKILPLSIPKRIDTIIIVAFFIQIFITSSVGYTLQLPNAFINNRWYMNLALISYRTDMMAISLFPVIFLFGIRNNPFIALTGIPFSTFVVYHRWCAIAMVGLSFVHGIIWTVDAIKDGGYKSWAVDLYFQYGIASCILAWLLITHSEKVIRDLLYEVFLIFHKLFNIFFIVTMYYHLNTLGWLGWVWSMAGILIYDRLVRWVRIFISGGLQQTTVVRCETDVIKLVLNKPKFVNYTAGSYAFIYFMSPWYYGWQSHPFSVISSPLEENGKLVVYFKLRKGITKNILERLIKADSQTISMNVLIEGPYKNLMARTLIHKAATKYIGLAGGSGLVSVFPHFVELLKSEPEIVHIDNKKFSESPLESTSTLNVEVGFKLKIFWVINNLNNVLWFQNELEWLSQRQCQVQIFLTGSDKLQDEKDPFSDLSLVIDHLKIDVVRTSRPDFIELVSESFVKSSNANQDLEIFTCGPSSFNDDLRFAVVEVLKGNKNSNVNVEYHAESFTW